MLQVLGNFRNSEDGAVSVDWVVLTAIVVVFGVLVGGVVVAGAETGAQTIGDSVATMSF